MDTNQNVVLIYIHANKLTKWTDGQTNELTDQQKSYWTRWRYSCGLCPSFVRLQIATENSVHVLSGPASRPVILSTFIVSSSEYIHLLDNWTVHRCYDWLMTEKNLRDTKNQRVWLDNFFFSSTCFMVLADSICRWHHLLYTCIGVHKMPNKFPP